MLKIWSGGRWATDPSPTRKNLVVSWETSLSLANHLLIFSIFLNTNFSLHLPRKGVMGAGETIQSYNHQKRDFQHRNISIDDDNIDVVNDNDKEPGETRR